MYVAVVVVVVVVVVVAVVVVAVVLVLAVDVVVVNSWLQWYKDNIDFWPSIVNAIAAHPLTK